ncbi:conserved exported hypothetical protein [Arthrobacter sp. 9AX]|uniref:hypothetical protein n=1 Tax=Arthrobacter sp. 9AX TaxID=2653131 RepID=UPI0012F136EF|nr:hypothetical protein [Arthrobacter sp. 9AX]VXC58300.1 conserved exported hypothetical protein [Arthrobacter sp. 9AX]
MAKTRSPWRALRPVFLAGAATLTWLALSTTAASADTLSDSSSLLGGLTSPVSSVTGKLAAPAPTVPAPPPAATAPAGLLKPVAAQVSGVADNIVSAVPVVNRVVPAGTVTAVAAPIAQMADGATAAVVEVVVPPVAESFPVLEPVLQPVSGVVTGTAPLPVELPELAPVVVEDVPATAAIVPAGTSAIAEPAPAENLAASESPVTSADTAASPSSALAFAGTAGPQWAAFSIPGVGHEQPLTADPSPANTQAPAAPGSGTGSGAASAGSPGSAAYLSPFNFDLPLAGAVCAGEASEHAPAPVSFDPGSSPD